MTEVVIEKIKRDLRGCAKIEYIKNLLHFIWISLLRVWNRLEGVDMEIKNFTFVYANLNNIYAWFYYAVIFSTNLIQFFINILCVRECMGERWDDVNATFNSNHIYRK
jgi:hypothetical protein